ncbi:MAG: hypothetical protein R3B54_05655 [Bdellovibrionota bacterium]
MSEGSLARNIIRTVSEGRLHEEQKTKMPGIERTEAHFNISEDTLKKKRVSSGND